MSWDIYWIKDTVDSNLMFIIRILIALLLGFAIGFERKLRFKEAGIRTHAMVAVGAALFMILSKYAFIDQINEEGGVRGADSARIAAQVVSGVGFLGAGMIMYRKQAVHGLTTAAGIWATAAVGMAIGAGMLIIGVFATALIILLQCIMHTNLSIFKMKKYLTMKIIFKAETGEENQKIKDLFSVIQFKKINAVKSGDDVLYTVFISTSTMFSDTFIFNAMKQYPFIVSIDRIEEDI